MSNSSKFLQKIALNTLVVSLSVVGTTLPSHTATDTNIVSSKSQAIETNLYASSKLGSVGKLPAKLQGKPVVIDIYASWCSACKNIAPTLSELKQEYADKAHFVVFDVTDRDAAKKSAAMAKELGLEEFFAANKSKTGTVVIVDPATGDILSIEKNNTAKDTYTQILDAQIAQNN